MSMTVTRMGKAGRLVIPARYRRALGLQAGSPVALHLDERGLHLLSPEKALAQSQELVRRYVAAGRSLSRELLAERRAEAARD